MPVAISLHIGLNRVDPTHYGAVPVLKGCLNDAAEMRDLAEGAGFRTRLLLNGDARAQVVLKAIRSAATQIEGDGILLVTFSGHGTVMPWFDGSGRPPHETWCVHDREILDLELLDCWTSFASGARVLVIADSCFSGGMLDLWFAALTNTDHATRALPLASASHVIKTHADLYRGIEVRLGHLSETNVNARVLLLSACGKTERAKDGCPHGVFTGALLEALRSSQGVETYEALQRTLFDRLKDLGQHPQLIPLGDLFVEERPFQI